MSKTQIFMNKPVYLGLSILELSNIAMQEFQYDYIKMKYKEKAKLRYVDTDSLVVYIKADDIYKDIAKDVETDRPLPKRKKKNVIGLMKDELGGKIMKEFVELRAKSQLLNRQWQ